MQDTQNLLSIVRLKKYFPVAKSSLFQKEQLYVRANEEITIDIKNGETFGLVGESGCGKSTFLKSLNRMNDLVEECRIEGEITLDGVDIYKDMDVNILRKKVGMVFQKPNPFPMSIYDNIAYGPRIHGIKSKVQLDEIVERSLRQAAIWDESKDRLKKSALGMSGGQQQRVFLARAMVKQPKILLLDEPATGIDTAAKADLYAMLKKINREQGVTIIMVSHDLELAADAAQNALCLDHGICFWGEVHAALKHHHKHGYFYR